jgi:mannosyltransferase
MAGNQVDPRDLRVIAPCLGLKFSGINASMIAVLPEQAKRIRIAAMGFHIPEGIPRIGFWQFCRHCRRGPWRIWHARRNVDMLAGLILRRVFRFRLLLVFTSAAQRSHTWITRFCYHRMDRLIATTAAAASHLEAKAAVVSHGVNTAVFSPPEDRATAWAARGLNGKFGIGTFGRVRPQKGSEEFVEAVIRVLPRRPDWAAVIVGQTTKEFYLFEQRLRARVRDAGLEDRVCFTGFLKRPEDIPDWYRSLSVVVCPSHTEGFGLSCLEAMASGCPVIATRTGAWPELVSDGVDGYLVPCADRDALAAALMRITEDPEKARSMGRQARAKVVDSHRIQSEAEGIQAVYEQLLSVRGMEI